MLIVSSEIKIPLHELIFSYVRSSGPGGQNVNKVNSKAVLHWDVINTGSLPEGARQRFFARFGSKLTNEGALVLSSDRYRDQIRNREDCLEKLREMLLQIARPPKLRKKTKPSRSSREKLKSSKRIHAHKKQTRKRVSRED